MAVSMIGARKTELVTVHYAGGDRGFYISDNGVVSFYWYFDIDSATSVKIASASETPAHLCPSMQYEVVPFYSVDPPYAQVGSMWISRSGEINVYKPSGVTKGYACGAYLAKNVS